MLSTRSPKFSFRISTASRECRRRLSNIVGRMPWISTSGLRFSRIIVSVFSSWTSPRSERYSHCTGTITPVAATNALIVSRPSDGGVSIMIQSYSSRTGSSAFSRARSRPIIELERELGAGEVDRGDGDVELVRADDLRDRQPVDEDVEHRAVDLVGVPALRHRQVALRVEVDREDLHAPSRRAPRRGSASSSSWRRHPFGSRMR